MLLTWGAQALTSGGAMKQTQALRQLQYRIGPDNMFIVQVTLVPTMSDEQKTKPTQHAVKELRSAGFAPDMICCRCERELTEEGRKKLGLFCQTSSDCIVSVHNVSEIYKVPLLLKSQNVAEIIATRAKDVPAQGHAQYPAVGAAVQENRQHDVLGQDRPGWQVHLGHGCVSVCDEGFAGTLPSLSTASWKLYGFCQKISRIRRQKSGARLHINN